MDAAKLRDGLQENLASNIGQVQEEVQQRVRRGVDRTQNVLSSLNEEFGSLVRESPVIALGGAFAVGYLAAKLARAFK